MIDENKLEKKYKSRLIDEFNTKKDTQIGRIDLVEQVLEDAKELITNPEILADIFITYAESLSDFNTEFEHKSEVHYESLIERFEEGLKIINVNNLKEKFEKRINMMIENSTDYYGQQEMLQEQKDLYW